jgi:hypothetical protein
MRIRPLFATVLLAFMVFAVNAGIVSAQSVETFVVTLTGDNGGDPDGSGTAVIRVDTLTGQVCYTITVRGIGVPTEPAGGLGAAHIHAFATGGIFVDLETNWLGQNNAFTTTGCVDVTSDQLSALLAAPEDYYVNIHTVEFPGGALSGALA